MHKEEFHYLANLMKKRSGLTLTEDKSFLIESRLLPIARARKLQDISQLYHAIRTTPTEDLLTEVTEAMTTNESSFFRDVKPFEQLRQIVFPLLMQSCASRKRLHIWSAACATGQEPYSIAMCIQEEMEKLSGWRVNILATDLAMKVLSKAKQGIYSQFEVQRGLTIQLLLKYFASKTDTTWQIKDNIRKMVEFKTQNLLEDYTNLGKFDLIFCRNVLIYFDEETKAHITMKMMQSLHPQGFLILGSTESLLDPHGYFAAVGGFRGAYKKKT